MSVALQAQEEWAYEHNVTLLAAGGNYPPRGSGGTGIYHGRQGPIVEDIIAGGGTNFYSATISKNGICHDLGASAYDKYEDELENFHLLRDDLTREFLKTLILTFLLIYTRCRLQVATYGSVYCNLCKNLALMIY